LIRRGLALGRLGRLRRRRACGPRSLRLPVVVFRVRGPATLSLHDGLGVMEGRTGEGGALVVKVSVSIVIVVVHALTSMAVATGMPRRSGRKALPPRAPLAAAERRGSWRAAFRPPRRPSRRDGRTKGSVAIRGAMTVAPAPDCRSFAVRSSRRPHGGLHRIISRC